MAVHDARQALSRDDVLKAEDIAHWRQLMGQTLMEIAQLGRAIEVLGALDAGRKVAVDVEVARLMPAAPRATAVDMVPIGVMR